MSRVDFFFNLHKGVMKVSSGPGNTCQEKPVVAHTAIPTTKCDHLDFGLQTAQGAL